MRRACEAIMRYIIFILFGYRPQSEEEAHDRECAARGARQAMAEARRNATHAALEAQATVSAGYRKQRRRRAEQR